MGDLHRHFSRSEFKCKCGVCACDTVDTKLLDLLIKIREHYGKPIKITSAHRCKTHNQRVGGTVKSQHLLGKAADIVVLGVEPRSVCRYLDVSYPNELGLGNYDSFTHIDVRDGKARW